jgi:hypothetical protein
VVRLVRAARVTPRDVSRRVRSRRKTQDARRKTAKVQLHFCQWQGKTIGGFLVTQEIAFPDFDVVGRF